MFVEWDFSGFPPLYFAENSLHFFEILLRREVIFILIVSILMMMSLITMIIIIIAPIVTDAAIHLVRQEHELIS